MSYMGYTHSPIPIPKPFAAQPLSSPLHHSLKMSYVLEGYRFKILNLSSVNSKIISLNDLYVSLLLSPIRLPQLFLPGLLSPPAAGTCKNEMGYISVTLNEALVVA